MEMSSPDLSPCSPFSAAIEFEFEFEFENLAMMITYLIIYQFFLDDGERIWWGLMYHR